MPENHDTDFNWKDFVERVNSELIAAYGNFVHRVMSLTHRISSGENNPLIEIQNTNAHQFFDFTKLEKIRDDATNSLKKHRYKEALRHIICSPIGKSNVTIICTLEAFEIRRISEKISHYLHWLLVGKYVDF